MHSVVVSAVLCMLTQVYLVSDFAVHTLVQSEEDAGGCWKHVGVGALQEDLQGRKTSINAMLTAPCIGLDCSPCSNQAYVCSS